jgi:hypothetical protein
MTGRRSGLTQGKSSPKPWPWRVKRRVAYMSEEGVPISFPGPSAVSQRNFCAAPAIKPLMNFLGGILSRLTPGFVGKRLGRGPSAVPDVLPQGDITQSGSASGLDATVDESIMALSRELSALAHVEVSQAAKERGWASLQRELERRPVRATGKVAGAPVAMRKGATRVTGAARPTARPAHSHTWRWALGSAAAAVAVIAALLGAYGAGAFQTTATVVDNGSSSTITSVVSSDTTKPPTTGTTTLTTENTTVTTGVQPSTTQGPGPTSTENTTVTTTGGPGTTGGGTTTTQPHTTTTKPGPTTTGEQLNTATQREGSARALAVYLADLVITGNTSGARALVTAEAQSSLAQMMMSLNEPYGYRVTGWQSLSGDTVRVTIEINDRVDDGQGRLVEVVKTFAVRVRVDDDGAVVTAINAG